MTTRLRVPPGRAGRLQLRRRLATAHRARELLDRKLRILRREQERLDLLVERTKHEWESACRAADAATLHAALLGGERAMRLATPVEQAAVTIGWTSSMGIRYPTAVVYYAPAESSRPLGTAALYDARAAGRRALDAAVHHAATQAALQIVGEEVAATRRRLRAIENRSIPQLQQSLAQLELALDEQEQADAARLRRAAGASDRVASHLSHADYPRSSRGLP